VEKNIAARYRRVSGTSQEDNTSLAKQLERIDEYCTTHEYETKDELLYTEVMTGVIWRERPKLQHMLKDAIEGKFQVVIIDHLDRLGRGEPLTIIMEQLSFYTVRVECVQVKIEDTEEGKLIVYLQSYSSKKEYGRIIKRTSDGRQDRVKKLNKPISGSACYGYKFDDPSPHKKNKYLANDDIILVDSTGYEWTERKVVVFIFEKAKEGLTLGKIADILTNLGIPTRKNRGYWTTQNVSKILGDRTYTGRMYAFRRTYTRRADGNGYDRKLKPLEEQYLMPEGVVERIIDDETFLIVQKQLDYNKQASTRNNKNPQVGILRSGYIFCGECGGAMSIRTNTSIKHKSPEYFCIAGGRQHGTCRPRNTIGTKIADTAAWNYTCDIIRNPKKLEESIKALKKEDPNEQHKIPVDIRRKKVEEEINSYVDLFSTAKTDTAKKRIQSWIGNLEGQLEEIEKEEKILIGLTKNWQAAQGEILRFENWCRVWREKLESANYADKRTCIEYLGVRATIHRLGSATGKRIVLTAAPPNILEKLTEPSKKHAVESEQSNP